MISVKRFLVSISTVLALMAAMPANAMAAAPANSTTATPANAAATVQVMEDGTLFDAQFYAQRYPDVTEYYKTSDPAVMYRHYQEFGRNEGRLPYAGAKVQPVKQEDGTSAAGTSDSKAPAAGAADPKTQATEVPAAGTPAQQTPATEAPAAGTPAQQTQPKPAVQLQTPPAVPTLFPAEEQNLRTYFKKSVFVGDSIMVGYRNYLTAHKNSIASGALFLAAASYSADHALRANDSIHPAYRGKKAPVWQNISAMDVDRVFIMFGTNDLVVKDSWKTAENIYVLIDQIRNAKPGIEIHLISMPPVYSGAKVRGMLHNEGVQILNDELRKGLSSHSVDFIEINTYLRDETGGLRAEYCSDRYVHQTSAAYGDVWDAVLTEYARKHS